MDIGGTKVPACVVVPGAPVQQNGVVLVVSALYRDAATLSELLVRVGYRCEWCEDPSGISCETTPITSNCEQYAATVYYHRIHGATDDDLSLPERLPGKRVIVLSDSDSENTVVSLLNNGAHHFFDMHQPGVVLQARLEAALRQHRRLANTSFTLGDIHFDVPKRRVSRAGRSVGLSPKEYDLAYYLFSNRDRVVGNSELMTSIWSLPPSMDTRRIDTAACRLRKKMQLTAPFGWELKRLRRVGYKLIPVEDGAKSKKPGSLFSAAAHSAIA